MHIGIFDNFIHQGQNLFVFDIGKVTHERMHSNISPFSICPLYLRINHA